MIFINKTKLAEEFKFEIIKQITRQENSVTKVASKLSTLTHSLYIYSNDTNKPFEHIINIQKGVIREST